MLDAAGTATLHEAALRVLADTGVVVQDEPAVRLLVAQGARADGSRVLIPEGAVAKALAAAPSSFTLRGRVPARDVHFGDGHAVYGSCSGAAYVLEGGRVRPGTLADLADTVRLGHTSRNIVYHGDSVEALDVPEEQRTRRGVYDRLLLSDKAGEWVATSDDDIDVAVRANEILFGAGWESLPRALIVLNTSSPLLLTRETAAIQVRWARLGQPSCATSCVMGGTTGPATLAGVLIVQHAEVLASLVLAQAAGPGSPFIYGGLSTMASLRTGAAYFGTPEFALLAEATVALAHHCGLPVRAGAAVTDAHMVDAQAALESAQGLEGAVRAGADFAFQAAGVLSSFNVVSLEKYVVDDEMIGGQRVAGRALDLAPDDLAREVIDDIGPTGGYLGHAHTRAHARDHDHSGFLVREPRERWEALGAPDALAAARREVARRLEAYSPPDDLDEVTTRQLRALCLAG